MSWSIVKFGKYSSKTLPQIICTDPDWFFWAVENDIFNNKGKLYEEANKINYLSRNIKIPDNEECKYEVEYFIHTSTGKFSHFEIIPHNKPQHRGSSPSFRLKVIDMSTPRKIVPYDKLGCKILLASLKESIFGNSKIRFNKKICEDFFSDSTNFVELD
ncbi:MAG: hypothetical protein PHP65_05510 [Bacilli bacterium]|nr:hypothetical protein [Bacilli bacterium]